LFGRWWFIAIRMGFGVGIVTILRQISSNPPLGVVMEENWSFSRGLGGIVGDLLVVSLRLC